MSALVLDFHGVTAAVRGDAEAVEELARDFAWFRAGERPAALEIELALGTPAAPTRPPRLWPRTPRYRVVDEGPRRTVLYADGARLTWDFAGGRGLAEAEQSWRLRELGYLALLSRVGEALEERGWLRAHALGFARGGAAGLVLLPSGGGKSTLALEMLRRDGWGLLSDDTPLVSAGCRARPFPLRLGLPAGEAPAGVPAAARREFRRLGRPPKTVVDVDFFRGRVAGETPVRWLVIGARRQGPARARAISGARALAALVDALVVGRGIAQLSELMLRPGAWRLLPRLAAARWRAARAMTKGARSLALDLGDEPAAALEALEGALG